MADRRLRAVVAHGARWLGLEDDPSGVVYGTIVVGTILATESDSFETYPRTVAALVIGTLTVWVAHSYADMLAHRFESAERLGRRAITGALRADVGIMRGAIPAVLALAVGWAAGIPLGHAANIGLWVSVVALVLFELAAGIRNALPVRDLVTEAVGGALLGATVLAIRIALH